MLGMRFSKLTKKSELVKALGAGLNPNSNSYCSKSLKYGTVYNYLICIRVAYLTEVLSVRVRKSLKLAAEKLGVDLRLAVEKTLEELVAEKKKNAQRVARELRDLMDVKPEEWVEDVRTTRQEM